MTRLSYEEMRKRIDAEPQIDYISAHDDADGIISAVLFQTAVKVESVDFPIAFEDLSTPPVREDRPINMVVLDKRPAERYNIESNGWLMVIDHHSHPETVHYNLLWDTVPASLITYRLLKDRIPDEEKFKVAIGLTGDGQAELIPDEIWALYPELLWGRGRVYDDWNRGGMKYYQTPTYMLLSGAVNALAKVGEVRGAYNLVKGAKSPLDILGDSKVEMARKLIKDEEKKVKDSSVVLDLGWVVYWEIDSRYKLEGTLASEIGNCTKKTAIVFNKKTGKGSIRGTLALPISEKLGLGGGHPGFVGFEVTEPINIPKALQGGL